MKRFFLLIFVVLCMLVCIVPSVCMIFNPTTETIGNEQQIDTPKVKNEDSSINLDYFEQLSSYFDTHFAYRPEIITMDATIQSQVFSRSNLDSVIVGKDSYLYYYSTLNDYLGADTMSDREMNAVIHNLEIINNYAKSDGVEFLFTIAPNKSTLYPEFMPYYYSHKVSDTHNRDLFNKAIKNTDINYVNLFELFENQDEVLYFKRDSHWNDKGALLAYNEIMDTLSKSHDDYSTADVQKRKDFVGDLSKMLYPTSDAAEYNYYYGAQDSYSYVTDTKSVEEAIITTKNENASGSLYMYRDSFGNSLLPFFASAYENATFTKAFPMILPYDLDMYTPDTFVMEIAERNLCWLIERPPILQSPVLSFYTISDTLDIDVTVDADTCEYSSMYMQFTGEINNSYQSDESVIYIDVTDENANTTTYECYDILAQDDSSGFIAYAPAQKYSDSKTLTISVVIEDNGKFVKLGTTKVNM